MTELTDAAYLRAMADTNFTPSFEPQLSRHIERLLRIADALDRRAPPIDASRAQDARDVAQIVRRLRGKERGVAEHNLIRRQAFREAEQAIDASRALNKQAGNI